MPTLYIAEFAELVQFGRRFNSEPLPQQPPIAEQTVARYLLEMTATL